MGIDRDRDSYYDVLHRTAAVVLSQKRGGTFCSKDKKYVTRVISENGKGICEDAGAEYRLRLTEVMMEKGKEVLDLMETRRSIRKFEPDMIPKEVLDRIIRAGTYAATGMNKQSPIIIAVTNKEMRDKLSRLNAEIMGTKNDPFYGAPVVLIVLADKNWVNHVYDGSLVMGNLMLAAHALGIGSCWIHRAKEEFERPEGLEILKSLGISGEYEGIGHCVLGYVKGDYPKTLARKENWVYYID